MPIPTDALVTNSQNCAAGAARKSPRWHKWLLAGLPLLLSACGRPAADPAASLTEGPRTATSTAGAVDPSTEYWEAIYQETAKIGHAHTTVKTVTTDAGPLVVTAQNLQFSIQRFGQKLELQMDLESTETPEGEVRSFVCRTVAGSTPLTVRGAVRAGKLHLTTTSEGQETTRDIPWVRANRGLFADRQSLERAPLQPGEQRRLDMLWPGLAGVQVITTGLTAEQHETVEMPDGERQLLRIKCTNQIGDQQMESVAWADDQGRIWKAELPGMGAITYRTTRDQALAAATGNEFDFGWDAIVRVDTPLPRPHATRHVVYQATLPQGDPATVFATTQAQTVRALDPHTIELTVIALRPDQPADVLPPSAPPIDSDSQPNSLIQSNAAQVVRLAGQIAADQKDPWQVACALEAWVHQGIRLKNFSQGFATAAKVAETLEGDCTEHAVLLAALCRARQIPARVAVGLVYSPADQGFAFHMWTHAWIRDRWIPLDATLGLGGIGAAHLTLAASDLTPETTEAAVIRVAQVLGQLQLKIVSCEPQP